MSLYLSSDRPPLQVAPSLIWSPRPASAFDSTHPYYDEVRSCPSSPLHFLALTLRLLPQKSDRSKPTWFCVDVAFRAKLAHPVTLGLLKHIASIPSKDMKTVLHASGLEALTPRAVEGSWFPSLSLSLFSAWRGLTDRSPPPFSSP